MIIGGVSSLNKYPKGFDKVEPTLNGSAARKSSSTQVRYYSTFSIEGNTVEKVVE